VSDVNSVSFSPDGKIIAGVSTTGIELWDATIGKHLRKLQEDKRAVPMISSNICFSPDGKKIVIGNMNGTVRLWSVSDVSKVDYLETSSRNQGDAVNSVCFSPDGKMIAYGTQNGIVELLDAITRKHLGQLAGRAEKSNDIGSKGPTWGINSINFSPDGKIIASSASILSL